jgi:hypothetical protein
MDNSSFWLFNFDNSVLSVSLVQNQNGSFKVAATGPQISYQPEKESVVAAANESMYQAATQVGLSEDQEPDTIALIIPPFWVGSDGKIITDKLKLIDFVRRDLKLTPMGFISYDDAIVENANNTDGFPASFVLVNIGIDSLTVSLTYLGKIIERINKPLPYPFDASVIENCLIEFKSESTLPPQIILFGTYDDSIVESIKNYTWIGKKNIETFLHFPDIKNYTLSEINTIYTRAITLQFKPQTQSNSEINPTPLTSDTDALTNDTDDSIEESVDGLAEVSAAELGFDESIESPNFITPPEETIPLELVEDIPPDEIIPGKINRPALKLSLPKLKLPRINIPRTNFLLLPLVLSPLLILLPFFFSKAKITLYITPYNFNKQVQVTLDPSVAAIDLEKKTIPVNTKTYTVNSSASVPTTGNKTIGDKARGEIIVYNKLDKVQNLVKGLILVDDKGNKFELAVAAQVASSSSNLDAGVINLGQTKVMITAADIGPEYNLSKDTKLNFKDYAESILIAKVKDQLSGGTKSQIKAVSPIDKIAADQKIKENITAEVDSRISKEIGQISGIIKDTLQIKKGRIEYSREIGEEADELTANSVNTITIYYLDSGKKTQLLDAFLSSEDGYANSTVTPDNFNISISSAKNSGTAISGLMTIEGKSTLKVDIDSLKKQIYGKNVTKAQDLIKKVIPRVYNFQINRNLSFLNFINPLPYRLQNITIEVK